MMKISTSMDRLLGGREKPRDNYDSIPNENETSQTLDERDSMVIFVNAIIGNKLLVNLGLVEAYLTIGVYTIFPELVAKTAKDSTAQFHRE